MPQHIGIVAVTAEGAALCYRHLCSMAMARMGPSRHPEISLHGFPLARYFPYQEEEDWDAVAELLIESAHRLHAVGADFIISPCNTIHEAFDRMIERSPLPWIHIVDAVAEQARDAGFQTLAVLGTAFTMRSTYYPERLAKHGLDSLFPAAAHAKTLNRHIYYELVKGECTAAARDLLVEVIADAKRRGADAVVMGCTELPLLIDAFRMELPLPVLDSTRLLAEAALDKALA